MWCQMKVKILHKLFQNLKKIPFKFTGCFCQYRLLTSEECKSIVRSEVNRHFRTEPVCRPKTNVNVTEAVNLFTGASWLIQTPLWFKRVCINSTPVRLFTRPGVSLYQGHQTSFFQNDHVVFQTYSNSGNKSSDVEARTGSLRLNKQILMLLSEI